MVACEAEVAVSKRFKHNQTIKLPFIIAENAAGCDTGELGFLFSADSRSVGMLVGQDVVYPRNLA